jgi:hypothetical protein
MDGSNEGAFNKVENALKDAATGDFSDAKTELSAAWNDVVTSTESLLGRAMTDGEKLAVLGIQTLTNDLATPLGQVATAAISTAIADGLAGKSVAQIGADILPTLETSVVADAKAAGQDVENTVLNTVRVMVLGTQAGNAESSADTPAAPAT